MITKFLVYVILFITVSLGSFAITLYIENGSLEDDNKNKDQAIQAYEEIIKVIPYNTLAKERNSNAKEEINATLSNDNSIRDGHYRL